MSTALTAFMDQLIDYAGLFPPAALDVPAAVAEFARHRGEPEAWMLGRFIAPAGKLEAIGIAAQPHLRAGPAWGFSVLVGARANTAAALADLATQAADIKRFEASLPGRVQVECLEAPIPLVGAGAETFVPAVLTELGRQGLARREIFLEVLPGGDDQAVLAAIAGAGEAARDDPRGFRRVGAKLRCGGITPEAFPSCERVAAFIQQCVSLDLALKCTAGLHHPVRQRSLEPDTMMHGFLNVFGAGMLAWSGQTATDVLVGCLAETDPAAFVFDGETFAWRDHRVDAETMRRIRSRSLGGFGSCSFVEPRTDLQDLGVL